MLWHHGALRERPWSLCAFTAVNLCELTACLALFPHEQVITTELEALGVRVHLLVSRLAVIKQRILQLPFCVCVCECVS